MTPQHECMVPRCSSTHSRRDWQMRCPLGSAATRREIPGCSSGHHLPASTSNQALTGSAHAVQTTPECCPDTLPTLHCRRDRSHLVCCCLDTVQPRQSPDDVVGAVRVT